VIDDDEPEERVLDLVIALLVISFILYIGAIVLAP
jgi:hypothetical protein